MYSTLRVSPRIRSWLSIAPLAADRQAWLALKYLLDYPEVQVYYGSWVEWGKLSDMPIELSA